MNEYLAPLVDELYRLGVRHVVCSPGSRSTALALLFKYYGSFTTYMNIDERSAAFFALGIAKKTGEVVVLVCTSGSAIGHYMPAVMEAYYTGIPLLILSADRPATLQKVGAPQTVDQEKILGSMVRYYEELSKPDGVDFYQYPRTIAQKAYMNAMHGVMGPVHINVPLCDPLIPELEKKHFEMGRSREPFRFLKGDVHVSSQLSGIEEWQNRRIVIVVGPNHRLKDMSPIITLAERLYAPILADPLSNMRRSDSPFIIDAYDVFLKSSTMIERLQPDYIIQFGQMSISKRLQQYIAFHREATYIQVDATGLYRNSAATTTTYIEADIGEFCKAIDVQSYDDTYVREWIETNRKGREQLERVREEKSLFEGRCVQILEDVISDEAQLVVANSMSIRNIDYFWKAGKSQACIYGNRGTNGIDGTISTAFGLASTGTPTVLVTGDLSMFHDSNGLLLGKLYDIPLTIILFNNDGGGIFHCLPQKDVPYFDELFSTPHGIDFSGLQILYGLSYSRVASYEEYQRLLEVAMATKQVHIIEVPTDKETSATLYGKYTVIS